MSSLWVFGNKKYNWIDSLAINMFKTTNNIKDFTVPNTSIEYIPYQFNQQRHNMKFEDNVIVFLTDLDKRWFYPNNPDVTCKVDKITDTAVRYYYAYLNNKMLLRSNILTFLNDLQGWTQFRKLRTIVISETDELTDMLEEQRRNLFLLNIAHGSLKEDNDVADKVLLNIKENKPIIL